MKYSWFVLLIIFVTTAISFSQAVTWLGIQILTESTFTPSVDNYGRKWIEKDYNDISLPEIIISDGEWKCYKCDGFYRRSFELNEIEFNNTNHYIIFESDDGYLVYVSGKYLGHWKGDQHLTACVNRCYKGIRVEPVYINEYLNSS
ncbi:MAG: hypothetical protein NTV87_14360 [Ignavibacteriae bacterium]|nr:hypothetical protein [Ignavibacteriota bacterium]